MNNRSLPETSKLRSSALLTLALLIISFGRPAESTSILENPTALKSGIYQSSILLESFGEIERASELMQQDFMKKAGNLKDEKAYCDLRIRLLVRMGMYERADTILASYPTLESTDDRYVHILARARLNYLSGMNERALHFITALDSFSVGTYRNYAMLLKMEILNAMENYGESITLGESVMKREDSFTPSLEFGKVFLDALQARKKYERALELIDEMKKKIGWTQSLAPFLKEEMKILLAEQDTVGILRLTVDAAKYMDKREISSEFSKTLLSILPPNKLGSAQLEHLADVFLDSGDKMEAAMVINELAGRELDGDYSERVRFLRARLLFLENEYSQALAELRKGFKNPVLAEKSMLLKARAYRRLNNYLEAADAYHRYASFYPLAHIAPEALMEASSLYERVNYITRANRLKHHLIDRYPHTYYGRLAAVRLSQSYMEKHDFRAAAKVLEEALKSSGAKSEELLFHLAQVYVTMGFREKSNSMIADLRALNPASFYLHAAVDTDYRLPLLTSRGKIDLASENGLLNILDGIRQKRQKAYEVLASTIGRDGSGTRMQENQHFAVGAAFLHLGFMDWGSIELNLCSKQLKKSKTAMLSLGQLYNDYGLLWQAVDVFMPLLAQFQQNQHMKISDAFDVLLYPVPFPGIVMENCLLYKLPPHLVFALIRVESRFDVNAISSAGALGLMQIMPETGKSIALDLGFPMNEDGSLFIPEVNIAFGLSYLSTLLRRCNGNYHMMLAAYNAGFSNAKRWFADSTGNASIQQLVDNIGFKETRLYVRRVIAASNRYVSMFKAEEKL